MSPSKAAKIIGCSPDNVRHLIRTNQIVHTKRKCEYNQYGYVYDIAEEEVRKIKNNPRTRGWKRGRKRGPA